MGYFSEQKMNKVVPMGDSNKLRPGDYPRLRISGPSKLLSTTNGMYFTIAFDVVEPAKRTDDRTPPHEMGSNGDFTVQIDDNLGYGKREVKAFALAVLGTDDDTVDVEGPLDSSLSGAWVGREVKASVWHKMTGNDRQITKFKFSPAEGGAGAVQAPPPPPPAPPAEPEGGPWYPVANDPRGTHYNAQGKFITR